MPETLLFESSSSARKAYTLPTSDVPEKDPTELLPREVLRSKPAELPELSQLQVVRHFVRISNMNYHIDKGFYPLGSCTMKYNPKVDEDVARYAGFAALHPSQPEESVQGALRLMHELEGMLSEIGGMSAVSLQPAAGAHGELTGLIMIRAYHEAQGRKRKVVLIPDSAHGTNPASVRISGYQTVQIKSNKRGRVDLDDLKRHLNEDVAALMLTNPNTLGLFETEVEEISRLLHAVGALVYMDGANLNALLGIVRPGDMGVDVMHFNLHKTFSTPHGGGGPGAGPVGVSEKLVDFLPVPRVVEEDGRYRFEFNRPKAIGRVHSFYGNFGMMVRAYIYIRMHGARGLRRIGENAVLNANYLMSQLQDSFKLPYEGPAMHEFVLSGESLRQHGLRTLDLAKRLLDYGVHAPTIYFPLIVREALMIEPTETESRETLDAFAEAMKQILREAEEDPSLLKEAPKTTPVSRLDEVKAAKDLIVRYRSEGE